MSSSTSSPSTSMALCAKDFCNGIPNTRCSQKSGMLGVQEAPNVGSLISV